MMTIFVFLLSIFGGARFYLVPIIGLIMTALGWCLIFWMIWLALTGRVGVLWPIVLWGGTAIILLVIIHLDIYQATLGRVWLFCVALSAMILSRYYLTSEIMWNGLYQAGWLYLVIGWFTTGWEYRNVSGFWVMAFFVVGFGGRSWLYVSGFAALLLFLGSRGAIIGAMAGLIVWLWPFVRKKLYYVPIGVLALIGLVLWRSETSFIRLHYLSEAWSAFWNNPLFGVGIGGLRARELITEWGGGYQIHAHNFIVSFTVETGVMGLIILAVIMYYILSRFTFHVSRGQLSFFVAVFAHSLVDEPLFWPGPLFLTAIILSTVKK